MTDLAAIKDAIKDPAAILNAIKDPAPISDAIKDPEVSLDRYFSQQKPLFLAFLVY